MIVGIGIDIVEIDRVESLSKKTKDRFYSRILSNEELGQLLQNKNEFAFVAGRFAVKEALIKALGGRHIIPFNKIKIINGDYGKAYLSNQKEIFESIDKRLCASAIHISISHEKKYAVANVIIEVL